VRSNEPNSLGSFTRDTVRRAVVSSVVISTRKEFGGIKKKKKKIKEGKEKGKLRKKRKWGRSKYLIVLEHYL